MRKAEPYEICNRCGYWTYSITSEDVYDDEGREVGTINHICPNCGDSYWLFFQGFGRDDRATILDAGDGMPLSKSIWAKWGGGTG